MALSKDDMKGAFPLPVYNYRVEIGENAVAFSDVSGLSIAHETTTYKESSVAGGAPGPRIMHMPAQPSAANVTLKKGMLKGVSVPALYDWINSKQAHLIEKKDVFVRLLDENGEAVISWKVSNAFPTKLDAPSFTADSNDVAIESLELMADRVSVEEV